MHIGRSGDWAKVCASQLRLSTLSRRKRVWVASGLEALMNWVLAEAGTSGRSALQCSLWPRYSRILDPGGMYRRMQLQLVRKARTKDLPDRCRDGILTARWAVEVGIERGQVGP